MTSLEETSLRVVESESDFHCITCSDEGCPMTVVMLDTERALALCEGAGGERQSVEIALVDAHVGDTLLVHAGTALLRL